MSSSDGACAATWPPTRWCGKTTSIDTRADEFHTGRRSFVPSCGCVFSDCSACSMIKRKICVVVTARPSYSRIRTALKAIDEHPDLELQLVVAASALLERYGNAIQAIEHDGFVPAARVYMGLGAGNPVPRPRPRGSGPSG